MVPFIESFDRQSEIQARQRNEEARQAFKEQDAAFDRVVALP